MSNKYRVWNCKIVISEDTKLPDGFDSVPRAAAWEAIEETGVKILMCFSGWGGELDHYEQEVVDKDMEEKITPPEDLTLFNEDGQAR